MQDNNLNNFSGNFFRMALRQYTGPIFQGDAVHSDLWQILQSRDLLVEITYGLPPYQVVLGVPHHARTGVAQIADTWTNPRTKKKGRVADENIGLPALAVFKALCARETPSKLVIAAHATDHDPNKESNSLYFKRVFGDEISGLLLELHGAREGRKHLLELTAGKNEHAQPLKFGRHLAQTLQINGSLAAQIEPHSSEGKMFAGVKESHTRLDNPALETASLSHAGIPALHLELQPPFRQPDPAFPDDVRPSPQAWLLAHALAETIQALYPNRPTEPE